MGEAPATVAPRTADVGFSRPFVFVPYTSAVISSGAATFQLLIPAVELEAENGTTVRTVARHDVQNLVGRYVYLFVAYESGAKLYTGDACLLRIMYRVVAPDMLEFTWRPQAFAADDTNEFPEMFPEGKAAIFQIQSDLRYFAIGSPYPLSTAMIREIETNGPGEIPFLDLFGDFPYFDFQGTEAIWAMPVLDPLAILDGLRKKYYAVCDEYLAHTQDFEEPKIPERVTRGQLQVLRKGVADSLQGLRKATVQAGVTLSGLNVRELDNFLRDYKQAVEKLRERREEAAYNLVKWLEGPWMTAAERWAWGAEPSPRKLTDPNKNTVYPYVAYEHSVGLALARLNESDTGAAYLSQTLQRAKDKPKGPGVLRAINELILTDKTPDADLVFIGRKAAVGVFGAWSAFVDVMTAHIAAGTMDTIKVGQETRTVTELRESVHVMTKRLSYIFDGEVIHVESTQKLKVPVKLRKKIEVIEVDHVKLAVLKGAEAKLKGIDLQVETLKTTFSMLNAGLSYKALREGLRKGNIDASTWSSAFDLAESLVFLADQLQKIPAFKSLRMSVYRPVPLEASVISRRLGIVGAGLSLAGASVDALNSYKKHDWNAAAASMVAGIGSTIQGAGYYVMAITPKGTPVGGYMLLGGAGLTVLGLIAAAFAKDTPYDQLAKFSSFGDEAGEAVDADGWAQCASFAKWHPKGGTPEQMAEGLNLQLRAGEQLFYSFRAQGFTPSDPGWAHSMRATDGYLRILPSALRPASVFYIEYKAEYADPPDLVKPIERGGWLRIDMNPGEGGESKPKLKDFGRFFIERDAVSLTLGDNLMALEIRLRPRVNPLATKNRPMELRTLLCWIRLDVYGDGTDVQRGADGSVVVPTTVNGQRRLKVILFEDRKLVTNDPPAASYDDGWVE